MIFIIFITGDTHGLWMNRLNRCAFPEGKLLTKNDYVIVCGDFGYWNDDRSERYALHWLDERPWTTLFLDGNHENFDRLYNLPVTEWNGGKIHKINNSVFHLMRGQIFEIENKSFFIFGGAQSHDISDGILEKNDPKIKSWHKDRTKMFRINHESWWEQELPTVAEMEEGLENLKKHKNKVDYIMTHSPYSSVLKIMVSELETDRLTMYLEEIKNHVKYRQWFFGHMHINKNFYFDKSLCIYQQILRLL